MIKGLISVLIRMSIMKVMKKIIYRFKAQQAENFGKIAGNSNFCLQFFDTIVPNNVLVNSCFRKQR